MYVQWKITFLLTTWVSTHIEVRVGGGGETDRKTGKGKRKTD